MKLVPQSRLVAIDHDLAQRAASRFATIRERTLAAVRSGQLASDLVGGSGRIPDGYCLSTVARVSRNAPELIGSITDLQDRLRAAGETYCYPAESLHISLLGLTGREPLDGFENPERIGRARATASAALADLAPFPMAITGLNLLGNQWFLEVVPTDSRWADVRRRIGAAAADSGEAPMLHPDTEPIHLNVARVVGRPDPERIVDLLAFPQFTAEWTVHEVELFLTDFVVDPAAAVLVDRWTLSG